MMKNLILIAIVFAGLLATGCTTTYLSLTENNKEQIEQKLNDYEQDENEGAELTISLMNGTEINGELLSVRDSTITLSTKHSATEDELANLTYPVTTVRNDEIKELTVEGSNYVWVGLGIGMAAGTGIGYLVGLASEPNRHAYISPEAAGGAIGFIVGALAGPIVGHALSTDDVMLQEIPPGYDMSFLKPLARYPDEEPEYLRATK
jgi:hypothetical protein